MGGDLNLKKEWHPGTIKNQTIVWKREQAVLEEERKLAQLKKEKAEEESREELEILSGGRRKHRMKVEWMYSQAPNTQSQSFIEEDKEAYLLGKKKVDDIMLNQAATNVSNQIAQSSAQGSRSSIYGMLANTTRDIQSKVRDDPLLAFKRQEQLSLQAVMKNPLKLKELQKLHGAKKKKRSRRSRSRSPAPRESDVRASLHKNTEEKLARYRSRSREESDRPGHSSSRRRSRSPERRTKNSPRRTPPRHARTTNRRSSLSPEYQSSRSLCRE